VAGFYVSPFTSVVDPDSLKLDPDPAFQVILIQGFDDKKIRTAKENIFFLDQKLQFTYRILGPLRTSKLQEKPSAFIRENLALQKMKFINFFFSIFWFIFSLLDSDPQHCHAIHSSFLQVFFFSYVWPCCNCCLVACCHVFCLMSAEPSRLANVAG
jgi:hypothetical protein